MRISVPRRGAFQGKGRVRRQGGRVFGTRHFDSFWFLALREAVSRNAMPGITIRFQSSPLCPQMRVVSWLRAKLTCRDRSQRIQSAQYVGTKQGLAYIEFKTPIVGS